jgi:4'-phosphopantetheinyl transferase
VLWLARGEDAMPVDPAWLTAGEAERAAGLRYTKRRTDYLLRRLAAKHAVAAAVGLSAQPGGGPDAATLAQIEVRNYPSGAPYVLLDGSPCGLGCPSPIGPAGQCAW